MVVALDEILPGELGVAGFGGYGSEVEAQGVGVVLAQEVGHLDSRTPALAELSISGLEAFMVARDKRH